MVEVKRSKSADNGSKLILHCDYNRGIPNDLITEDELNDDMGYSVLAPARKFEVIGYPTNMMMYFINHPGEMDKHVNGFEFHISNLYHEKNNHITIPGALTNNSIIIPYTGTIKSGIRMCIGVKWLSTGLPDLLDTPEFDNIFDYHYKCSRGISNPNYGYHYHDTTTGSNYQYILATDINYLSKDETVESSHIAIVIEQLVEEYDPNNKGHIFEIKEIRRN